MVHTWSAAWIAAGALCLTNVACSTSDGGGTGGVSSGGVSSGGAGLSTGSGGFATGGAPSGAGSGGGGTGGAATGGADAGGAAGASGVGGSAGTAGDASACTAVTLGAFQLLDTEPGGVSLAYSVTGLAPGKENVAYIEFYNVAGPQTAGNFDLSQPPDNNYSSCARCLLVYEDLSGTPTPFFPVSGTLNLTTADASYQGTSAGSFTGVTLVEVTVQSTVTTPVPGGRCLTLSGSWKHP